MPEDDNFNFDDWFTPGPQPRGGKVTKEELKERTARALAESQDPRARASRPLRDLKLNYVASQSRVVQANSSPRKKIEIAVDASTLGQRAELTVMAFLVFRHLIYSGTSPGNISKNNLLSPFAGEHRDKAKKIESLIERSGRVFTNNPKSDIKKIFETSATIFPYQNYGLPGFTTFWGPAKTLTGLEYLSSDLDRIAKGSTHFRFEADVDYFKYDDKIRVPHPIDIVCTDGHKIYLIEIKNWNNVDVKSDSYLVQALLMQAGSDQFSVSDTKRQRINLHNIDNSGAADFLLVGGGSRQRIHLDKDQIKYALKLVDKVKFRKGSWI